MGFWSKLFGKKALIKRKQMKWQPNQQSQQMRIRKNLLMLAKMKVMI